MRQDPRANTILLVGEDIAARQRAAGLLGGLFNVLMSDEYEQAPHICTSRPIDVVLTDFQSANRGEWALLKALQHAAPDIPVILWALRKDQKAALQALREGAFDCIEKPFDREDLHGALDRALAVLQLRKKLAMVQSRLLEAERQANLGVMAAGVAHEINTPLTVIHLCTEIMGNELAKEQFNKEVLQTNLGKISATVFRVSDIIKSLMALSRGGMQIPIQAVPVRKIVQNTLLLCAQKISSGQARMIVDEASLFVDAPMGMIHCREHELTQVLLNLISNAFDAIESLNDRWIKISMNESAEEICLLISDSGAGIPAEVRQKMFTPFFTTKPAGRGTGLGLTICRSLIESYRGRLELDDGAPNTTFVIRMPKRGFETQPIAY